MGDIEKLTNLVTQLAAAQIQTETQLSKLTEHMNNDTASNSDLIKDSPIVTGPELQAQAKELSEKYKSTTLDSDHRLHEERAGISRNDQKQLNVISKSGRCVETAFKILRSETQTNGDLSKSKVDELYTLLRAHLAYLQDEYGVCFVSSLGDENTAKIFRQLRKNTSALPPDAIEDLRAAAQVAGTMPSRQLSRGNDNRSYSHRSSDNRSRQQQSRPPRFQRGQGGQGRGKPHYPNSNQAGQDTYMSLANDTTPP